MSISLSLTIPCCVEMRCCSRVWRNHRQPLCLCCPTLAQVFLPLWCSDALALGGMLLYGLTYRRVDRYSDSWLFHACVTFLLHTLTIGGLGGAVFKLLFAAQFDSTTQLTVWEMAIPLVMQSGGFTVLWAVLFSRFFRPAHFGYVVRVVSWGGEGRVQETVSKLSGVVADEAWQEAANPRMRHPRIVVWSLVSHVAVYPLCAPPPFFILSTCVHVCPFERRCILPRSLALPPSAAPATPPARSS